MATLTLTQLWLNVADSPSTGQGFGVVGLKVSQVEPLEIQRSANGRLRAFTRPGSQQVLSCTVSEATRAEVNTLLGWIGTTLLVRDWTGRLFYGVYAGLEVVELGFADYADVGLQISEVTYQDTV